VLNKKLIIIPALFCYMSGNSGLEGIIHAAEIKRFYEVITTDRKAYLCTLLLSRRVTEASIYSQPVISDEKKGKTRENLAEALSRMGVSRGKIILSESESKGIAPNYRREARGRSAHTAYLTTYTIEAYRICREIISQE